MGQNKALLKLGNERIISRLTGELGDFSEVLVSCAGTKEYEDLNVPLIVDENKDIGPIEGIRRVLTEAREEYVFICAADMPFISRELVDYIAEFISSDYDCYVMADEDNIHPLCAIYKKSVLPEIENLIDEGQYRIRSLFKRVRTKYIAIEDSCFDKRAVKNINTREDYTELLKPFVFCVSGYSDSGKTFLIEKLINEFIADGYTVGVCKHDGHDVYEDKDGSDTDRFIKAGAVTAAIFTDSRFSIHVREKRDADDIIKRMEELEDPPDIIIIEGMKGSRYPKVVLLKDNEKELPPGIGKPWICIAADRTSPISSDPPSYGRDDVKGIFLCIKEYLGLP
ncbi:MAG: molybdopterin-guanine dinucleotide biosynthesis protein B [Lachnospiraceae bacterium]|nr:molybdopterin-guanine dinucleotide biosynthesis protein B [Lachnospiraceae bacterium]